MLVSDAEALSKWIAIQCHQYLWNKPLKDIDEVHSYINSVNNTPKITSVDLYYFERNQ
jgi:hypothetical protein